MSKSKSVKVFMNFEVYEMLPQGSIPMRLVAQYERDKKDIGETLAGFELIKNCFVDLKQVSAIEDMDANDFSEFLNLWMEASNEATL